MTQEILDLDSLTPAQYRARYEALQAAARELASQAPMAPMAAEILAGAVVKREVVPAGAYVAVRVKRGEALRVVNVSGTPGVGLFLWNADETSERYNAGDTVKLQWTTNFTTGRVLFSDMGRVMASITADSGAGHDSILGTNGPAQVGVGGRNGRENLRLAAAKFGLTKRDVGPNISLFSQVRTDAAGKFVWGGAPPAGALVELRAEMNLLVALSNTPHVLSGVAMAAGAVEVCVWRAPAAAADDLARHFSAEARRGFANTDEGFVA